MLHIIHKNLSQVIKKDIQISKKSNQQRITEPIHHTFKKNVKTLNSWDLYSWNGYIIQKSQKCQLYDSSPKVV